MPFADAAYGATLTSPASSVTAHKTCESVCVRASKFITDKQTWSERLLNRVELNSSHLMISTRGGTDCSVRNKISFREPAHSPRPVQVDGFVCCIVAVA